MMNLRIATLMVAVAVASASSALEPVLADDSVVVAASDGVQTASTVCVYNDAAFVLKWHLHNKDTNADSSESKSYPVWQTRCMPATAAGGAAAGASVTPVVSAVWGKTITVDSPVLYDPVNATQVTYVCKGAVWGFHCDVQKSPPTIGNVTKAVGKFLEGFLEGMGSEVGFQDCIHDLEEVFASVKGIVDFLETGFNARSVTSIVKAFQLIGDLMKEIAQAIRDCVKDAHSFAHKLEEVAAALSGNVSDVIKVLVEDGVHVWHDRKEITQDAKMVATSWRAGDFFTSGKHVGEIVGIIFNDI